MSRSYAGKGERDGEVWHDASDLVASKSDQNELTRLVVRTSDYVFSNVEASLLQTDLKNVFFRKNWL